MSEEICDFSDLPVSQCAHCNGDKVPPRHGEAQQDAINMAKEIHKQNYKDRHD